MSIDILIHKNSYTKTHTSIVYSLVKQIEKHHVINTHDKIYDLFYMLGPEKIVLQAEEYSNEWHSFIADETGNGKKLQVFITIDNNDTKHDQYISLLRQIQNTNATFLVPKNLNEKLKEENIKVKSIEYEYLYNSDVFHRLDNLEKNDKTLCIMSTDSSCINRIEEVLYPRSKEKIVLINNSEVEHDQNIGLMFDSDLNKALNTFGSVIDLSSSYLAEVVACETKISEKDTNKYPSKENIVTTDNFIQQHII